MSDLISREEAVRALGDAHFKNYGNAIMVIQTLPSAESKRKTGKWMGSVCSECGNSTSFYYDCDYCPNCGARMEGEK